MVLSLCRLSGSQFFVVLENADIARSNRHIVAFPQAKRGQCVAQDRNL
jgi:hypothetical protein